jgi:hypothetical protein
MVEGEAQLQLLPDRYSIVHNRRLRPDAADPEDGALGQIEDRGKGINAEHAQVGERDRMSRALLAHRAAVDPEVGATP